MRFNDSRFVTSCAVTCKVNLPRMKTPFDTCRARGCGPLEWLLILPTCCVLTELRLTT